MDVAALQKEICKVITGIGGHIKYKKELRLPARFYYFLSRKEPIINIEAFFLGVRFGVIIEEQKGNRKRDMFNSSGYRIMVCSTLADFREQFEQLKQEKLNAAD